jgi:hypothetical protein
MMTKTIRWVVCGLIVIVCGCGKSGPTTADLEAIKTADGPMPLKSMKLVEEEEPSPGQ